jgi:hypothetical protein
MWKHLVFPEKYFYKHSSEQFSRQVAWAIVMYTDSGQGTQEKQYFVQVFTFCILCRSRGDVGTAIFPLDILLQPLKVNRAISWRSMLNADANL